MKFTPTSVRNPGQRPAGCGDQRRTRTHRGRSALFHVRPPELPVPAGDRYQHADRRGLTWPRQLSSPFVGGLLLGSFVTVVGYRVPRGESIVGPRSRCTTCGAGIAAYDNVPVVSWVLLRGRSRCCGDRISARYPLTELSLGGLWAVTVAVLWGDPMEIALGLAFVTTLLAVTLTDLDRRVIPNRILLVAAVVGVALVASATLPACPSAPRRRRARAAPSSWSPSPTRGGWASAMSSWPR